MEVPHARKQMGSAVGVPPDVQHDDYVFEMSPTEQRWSLSIHALTLSNRGHSCLQQSLLGSVRRYRPPLSTSRRSQRRAERLPEVGSGQPSSVMSNGASQVDIESGSERGAARLTPTKARGVRFSVFEADLHLHELRKHGIQIKLPGQPFQALGLLLEHAGEVVTREEFRQALWPNEAWGEHDQRLNKIVNKIREALSDSAERHDTSRRSRALAIVSCFPSSGSRMLPPGRFHLGWWS
jgi:hypothetical protein